MAVARVTTPTLTEQGTAGTTTFVVSMPATVTAGELLVMAVGASGGVVSTPAGWTLIGGSNQAAADSCYGFYKVAAGTEGGTTVSVTLATAGRATGIVTRYSGVDTSTPIDVAATTGVNTGVGSTCVVASQTTVTNNAFLISACCGNAATGLTWTQPAGFVTPTTSTPALGALAGKGTAYSDGVTVSPAGATGTQTWTWNQTALKMDGWLAALRPAPAPVGQSFLTNAFGSARAAVEIAFGADITASAGSWTWTDVSADLMDSTQVRITQGRMDETSTAQAASATFSLSNVSGKYTPFAPMSALYPNVKKGTPVRVRVDVGSGLKVMFFGFAAGFTPVWDNSAQKATVDVAAGGLLRRLGQGSSPLKSPLSRAIGAQSPSAWWPLEDGANSIRASSGVVGGSDLVMSGPVTFGADGPAGAAGAVDFTPGGRLRAQFPAPITGPFRISATIKLTPTGSSNFTPLVIYADDGTTWDIFLTPFPACVLRMHQDTSGFSTAAGLSSNPVDGQWHTVCVVLDQNGTDVRARVWFDDVLIATNNALTGGFLGTYTLPKFTGITLNAPDPAGQTTMAVTNVAVTGNTATNLALVNAVAAYAGELADARLTRLCGEEAIPFTLSGSSAMPMGPQPTGTFLSVLRECETADGGLLLDGFDAGLVYVTRSSRYNLAADITVDASANQLSPPFAPVDDDQRIRNDFTASRSGGQSARYTDLTGTLGVNKVGDYDSSLTVNTQNDDPLPHIAEWNVHLGTVEGLRYPSQTFDFVAVPALANPFLVAGYPGQIRLDVTNVTSKATQAPPGTVSQMIEGWTATFDQMSFTASANCSPFAPWRVASVETGTYPLRVDSDNSTASAGINTVVTSLSVATAGPLWTTTATFPADFPLDIDLDGEQCTVTAIVGVASPQTFTITRSVNGVVKSHLAGAVVKLWRPASIAL